MGSKGGGGPSNVTSTQTPNVPGWLNSAGQNYLTALQGLTFNSPYSYLSYNPLQNPSTAPFTPTQLQGQQDILGAGGAYSQAVQGGLGALQHILSGGSNVQMPNLPPVSIAGGGGASIHAPNVNVNLPDINTRSGMDIGANANPYLQDYYQQAADEMTKLYRYSTAPSQMSSAAQAGAFGGSADAMQRAMSDFGLGHNLASLGAQIYEPAWAQQQQLGYQYSQLGAQTKLGQEQMQLQEALQNAEMSLQAQLAAAQIAAQEAMQSAQLQSTQNIAQMGFALDQSKLQQAGQLGALGMLPGLANMLYTPGQMEMGVGGMQQQQLQNIMNSVTGGANQMQQYPYNILGQYGGGVTSLLGPFIGQTLTQPNPQGGGSKK